MPKLPNVNSLQMVNASGVADISLLALYGQVFYASASAANTTVTGQTSFAATTPTFLIDVPSGTTLIPLMYAANQTGSVAGGDVNTVVAIDSVVRYSSGGTALTHVLGSRTTGANTPASTVYTNPTAAAAGSKEVRLMGLTQGADVSPAEGAIQEVLWVPQGGIDYLVGPAAFLVYTWAGTTGPTWYYTLKFAEIPSGWLPS